MISVAWGGSFVAQSKGGDLVGPFTFGFFRFLVAGIAILPIVAFLDSREKKSDKPKPDYSIKELIRDGFVCGFFLAGTSAFQQLGLFAGTPSGKAGFLTSCNVIFVPIICLFFKDKIKWNVWLSIVVTVCGLYLLCVNDGFGVQMSDVLVLICSVMNAARIIAVDRFKHKTDIIKLACVQFFFGIAVFDCADGYIRNEGFFAVVYKHKSICVVDVTALCRRDCRNICLYGAKCCSKIC